MLPQSAWLALTIAGLSLITEDGATALAAAAAGEQIQVWLAFASCFLGIWIGDLGLYTAARGLGRKAFRTPLGQRLVTEAKLGTAENWFGRRGVLALVASRMVPGSRLPTYLAAGFLKMRFATFAAVTALCAAAWVGAAIWIARRLPDPVVVSNGELGGLALAALTVFLLLLALSRSLPMLLRMAKRIGTLFRKYRRWEFWPPWLFYAPVALISGWLALRHRGLALPTIANPAQRNGGFIGESKIEILSALKNAAPDVVADAHLIPAGDASERTRLLETLLRNHHIEYPFVLKPDVAQRGAGFRKICAAAQAEEYLKRVRPPVVLQRYAPGPGEAGIFYYRFPGEARGEIFAITEKSFPTVTGDGVRTLRELIAADERASLIAQTYLKRHREMADRVIPAGQAVRLVEAGNHCQGCIFKDGMHLYSEELRARLDAISQALPEFFIGRYDVRYRSADELRRGQSFIIIELNGSSSEATNIYDSRNSLWSAYQTLYRQWGLVYRIGKMNRARGYQPASLTEVLRDLLQYRRLAAFYPAAD
jgi:membrane protein DedA with SNARE-associated domain